MKSLLIATLAAIALAPQAHAQRMTSLNGDALVRLCSSQDRVQVEACTAYIDGVADAAEFYQRLRPVDGSKGAALPGYVCVPGSTTGVAMRTAVVTYLRGHADEGRRQASGSILRALDGAFPCTRQPSHLPKE